MPGWAWAGLVGSAVVIGCIGFAAMVGYINERWDGDDRW